MTMVCIVGDPESIKGCGKTMTLAFLQYLDYKKGRRILTNVTYTFPHEQLNVMEVIHDLESDNREKYQNVSIGIDEFHLFMPSGQPSGNKGDQDLLINFLYQTRKLDIDVYYVTHRAMNVNNKIRGQIELMLMARKFHTKDGSHCIFDNCKEDHYIEVRNANDVTSFLDKEPLYINCSVVGALYPTNQLLPIIPEAYWQPKVDGRTSEGREHKREKGERIRKSMQDKWDEQQRDVDMMKSNQLEIDQLKKEIAEDEAKEAAQKEIDAEQEIIKKEQEIEEINKEITDDVTKELKDLVQIIRDEPKVEEHPSYKHKNRNMFVMDIIEEPEEIIRDEPKVDEPKVEEPEEPKVYDKKSKIWRKVIKKKVSNA